jgi:putative transposase
VTEVIRKLGISEQTFYRRKKRFAGLGIVELRRPRTLEEENRKLKQIVADLSLDKKILQDVLSKKSPMDPYPCVPTQFPSRALNTNVFL